jgi:uncharacterized protein
MISSEEIIEYFGMRPLAEEGGFYVETYRAKEKITKAGLAERYSGDRDHSTAILYLLTVETFSAMHRVKSDEVFHFYLGDAVSTLQLHPDGTSEVITLGQDILNGERVQVIVPNGSWHGCRLKEGGKFALMGCTVAPGFEFEDYENGKREELIRQYPRQEEMIRKLTKD